MTSTRDFNRLNLEMPLIEMMVTLAEGNIGAASVLTGLFEKTTKIDPDAALEGYAYIFQLDTYGIYGPSIWVLFKDICDQDFTKMMGLLRAVQLGILSEKTLTSSLKEHMANGRRHPSNLTVDYYLQKVKEELPNFGNEP